MDIVKYELAIACMQQPGLLLNLMNVWLAAAAAAPAVEMVAVMVEAETALLQGWCGQSQKSIGLCSL